MALKVGELFARLTLDDRDFDEGIDRAERRSGELGQSLVKTGGILSAAITAPVVGFGIAAINAGADFQKSMNQVRAVSGATGDDVVALSDTAKELGRTTQFSASQAADAMGFLAMAGFDASEIIGAMPGTLQLAAAANIDLARSADIVSNILTGYGLAVEDLGHANDVLVKAMTSTNVDLNMLGQSFKYVGPIAKSAGVSFEETAAAIGLLGNAGIQGSMAGTSLRQAIGALLNPSKEQQKIIEALGLTVKDTAGQFVGWESILRDLEASGADTGEMMALFGARAGPAMAALVGQGSDALRELTEELGSAQGIASEIAAVQMEGLRGAILLVKSALEGLFIAFAESGFLDMLTEFATRIASVVQGLAEINPEVLKFVGIVAAAAAAVGPILVMVGGLIIAFGALSAPILVAAGALVAVVAAGAAFAIWGRQIGQRFPGVARAMDRVARAIRQTGLVLGWFGNYIAEAVRSGDALNDWLEWLPEGLQPVAAEIAGVILRVRQLAEAALPVLLEAARQFWAALNDHVLPALVAVGQWMLDNVPIVLGLVAVLGLLVAPWLTIAIAVAALIVKWDELTARVPILGAVFDAVVNAIRVVWSSLPGIIAAVGGQITAWWNQWGPEIVEFARRTWDQVSGVTRSAWDAIVLIVRTALALIQGVWETAAPILLALVQVGWSLIRDVTEIAWGLIQGVISGALDIIRGVLDIFVGVFTGDWERVWDGAVSIVKGAVNLMITALNALIGAAEALVNALSTAFNAIPPISIPDWVPGIGGNSLSLPNIPRVGLPRIPMFARGVRGFSGGPAWVGEHGPELVNLPAGADVLSNAQSRRMSGGITVNVHAPNYVGPESALAEPVKRILVQFERTGVIRPVTN